MTLPRIPLPTVAAILCSALLITGCASSDKNGADSAEASAKPASKHVDPNAPLCPVGGEPVGANGEPVYAEYNGKTIGFCCEDCRKKFNADPVAYLHKVK